MMVSLSPSLMAVASACQASTSGRGSSCHHRPCMLHTKGHGNLLLAVGRRLELHTSLIIEPLNPILYAESLRYGRYGLGKRMTATVAQSQQGDDTLEVGSPVMIVEPPPMLKTAEPMPMMRVNRGLIKQGDAGRIIDRRPKDVWAIRFPAGAYLIDRKYFKPLSVE